MTTIVNNPAPVAPVASTDTGIGGFIIGAIVLLGVVMVLLYYGVPVLRRMSSAQITIPTPQIVLPNKIDVNVTRTK